GPAVARMRRDAHGLVDHDDVVVLVDQAHALGDLGPDLDGRLLVRQLDVHHRPGLETGGAGGDLAVDQDVPGHDEVGGAGAGQAQHAGDAHVHTLPGEAVGDHQGAGGAHFSASGDSSAGSPVDGSAPRACPCAAR